MTCCTIGRGEATGVGSVWRLVDDYEARQVAKEKNSIDTCMIQVFVEGQTEETFGRKLLYGYFQSKNIYLNPIFVKTSSTGKGGVVS
ncbi:MAG: hypothetical protein PUP92_06955 [Rhizonema sp. PD38]|nr:hypothetical protein [Rhizonema sp. PD38]